MSLQSRIAAVMHPIALHAVDAIRHPQTPESAGTSLSTASPDAARAALTTSRDARTAVEDADVDAHHAAAAGTDVVAHNLRRVRAGLRALVDGEAAVGLWNLEDRDADRAERSLRAGE